MRRKFILAAGNPHPFLGLVQHLHGLIVLIRAQVSARQLEELREAILPLPVKSFERSARAIEFAHAEQRLAEQRKEGRVIIRGRVRLQQFDRASGIAFAQPRFGEEERDRPVFRQQRVRSIEIIERDINGSHALAQLPRPQKASGRQVGLADLRRQFTDIQMAAGIIRIELRNPFVTFESLSVPVHFLQTLCGYIELLHRLRDPILFLQCGGVTQQPFGRLLHSAQKARIDGRGLRRVTRFKQSVKLQAVKIRGADRIAQT